MEETTIKSQQVPAESVIVENATSTSPKSNFPLIMVITGLLVIIGIGVLFAINSSNSNPTADITPVISSSITQTPTLILTPTLEPTADLKTFTNTKYGYSVQYSVTLLTKSLPTENQLVLTETADGQWLYQLSVVANTTNLTLDDIKQQELVKLGITKNDVQPQVVEVSTQNAKFQTLSVISGNEKPFAIAIAYMIKDNLIYYFYANSNKVQFDQILSTFRFTQ